jgi:hypothetical protein
MSTTRHQLRHMTWIPGGTFAMGSAGFDGAVYAWVMSSRRAAG